MSVHSHRAFVLATSCLILWATPSLALDEADFLRKLNASLQPNPIELVPEKVVVSGDDVTLENTVLKVENSSNLAIGNVQITDVKEVDGGYHLGSLTVPAFEKKESSGRPTLQIDQLAFKNIHIRNVSDNRSFETTSYAEDATSAGIKFLQDGDPVLTVGPISLSTTVHADKSGYSTQINAETFTINLNHKSAPPEAKKLLEDLQLETLTGSSSLSGAYEIASGKLDLDSWKLNLERLGTVDLNLGMSGLTQELTEQLNALSQKEPLNKKPAHEMSEEEKRAQDKKEMERGFEVLAIAQSIKINNFKLSYNDHGLTGKILDHSAKEAKMSVDQVKNTVKGLVPLMLMQWNLPSVQDSISKAVDTFIDNPKNFTISAHPERPIATSEFLAIAIDPNQFLETIKFDVKANQ